MNLSPIVLALALLGTTGTLQAGKIHRTPKAHKASTRKAAGRQTAARKADARKLPVAQAVHRVKRGETASRIAHEHHLDLETLAALNPGVNLAKLSLGTTLRIAAPKAPTRLASTHRAPALSATSEAIPVLPSTPRIEPGALVHLERMLPAMVVAPPLEPRPNAPSTGIPASELRPILPETPGTTVASTFEPADPEHLDLLWPVETRTVSSQFGPRMRTKSVLKMRGKGRAARKRMVKVRYSGRHQGVDLNAPRGTDIYAAMDGQVITAGHHSEYGNFIVIDHGNGVTTLYAHTSANYAKEGDIVHRGQKIAAVGSTGRSTGPHLHFELRENGIHEDPLPLLNEDEEISAEMMALNRTIASSN
nr:LysM peptidoglycan-binding domain-containing M23 family metallopeptidase [uncultured Holophaga sp.]